MRELTDRWLGGASSVPTLAPLAEMRQLRQLVVKSLRHVHDLSALGSLSELRSLEVGGDWMSPRFVHVDSVAFLRNLPSLERLVLHTLIADDLDYSPLLALGNLKEVRSWRRGGCARPTMSFVRLSRLWRPFRDSPLMPR
jgi:hypothetical protein